MISKTLINYKYYNQLQLTTQVTINYKPENNCKVKV